MKKVVAISAGVIAVAVLGGMVYAFTMPSDDGTENTAQAPTAKAPESYDTDADATATAGAYKEYSASAVASTDGTRLLFFHAPWCPQCRALEADIESHAIPEGMTIFKVDYDSHQDLRQKYGVTLQTTVVKLDAEGNLADKYVAYDEPTLKSVTDHLLK